MENFPFERRKEAVGRTEIGEGIGFHAKFMNITIFNNIFKNFLIIFLFFWKDENCSIASLIFDYPVILSVPAVED